MHPEFDFPLNLKRVLFGVWRQEQGVGAVAIHSHMADLPRILFLWLLSPVVPDSFLRYSYFFISLIVGPLGVYYFIRNAVFKIVHGENTVMSNAAAFVGGLYYLLNLGTLQHFYVPFEMFAAQYAFIGWLFMLATRLFYKITRRDMLWFIGLSFLASPMAYAATLYYAFVLVLAVYLGILCLVTPRKHRFKRAITIGLITLAVNSYWLLPNIYAIGNHSQEVATSRINIFFSEESFLHNQNYGTLPNILLLKSYLFNWSEHVGNGEFNYLLDEWRTYTNQAHVIAAQLLIVLLIVGGLAFFIKRRNPVLLALLGVAAISVIFLANANPPLGILFSFIRDHVPLFREALRTPYTKFSIPLMLCFAAALAYMTFTLIHHMSYRTSKVFVSYLLIGLISATIVLSMWPAFTGNYISRSMRMQIPQEYFQLYKWFSRQPQTGRVAQFPMPSFWGWTYYNWGYQGAGFVWFGIKQPVMDRDFDRWSRFNEQYYREVAFAVYSQNVSLFEDLMEKYGITTLLFDENIIVADAKTGKTQLYANEIKALLAASKKVKLQKQFGTSLRVYSFTAPNNKSEMTTRIRSVQPYMEFGSLDTAFVSGNPYVSLRPQVASQNTYAPLFYPFRAFVRQADRIEDNSITFKAGNYTVGVRQPLGLTSLNMPNYATQEQFLPVDVYAARNGQTLVVTTVLGLPWPKEATNRPQMQLTLPFPRSGNITTIAFDQTQPLALPPSLDDQNTYIGRVTLDTATPTQVSLFAQANTVDAQFTMNAAALTPERCSGPDKNQLFGVTPATGENSFTINSQNAIACVSVPLHAAVTLPNDPATPTLMDMQFSFASEQGVPPYYCIFDTLAERCTYTSYGKVSSANVFFDRVAVLPQLLSRSNIRFFLDATAATSRQELTYSNISATFTEAAATTQITPEAIAEAIDKAQQALRLPTISAFTGFAGEQSSAYMANITNVLRNPKTCSPKEPISYDRKVVSENAVQFVEYRSKNGTSCDHYDYPTLAHDRAYIVAITAKHISGLPIRVCVSNTYTKRCDVYSELGKSGEFKTYMLYVPPNTSPGFGYDVNIDNISIGNIESINQISAINVIPFPATFFSKIAFSDSAVDKPAQTRIDNVPAGNLPFIAVTRKGNAKNLLLKFDQGYEPGWKLFRLIGGVIPVPSGAEHIMVNNWQNGWLLRGEDDNTQRTYVIIFLPQLLQFLGFLLLALVTLRVYKDRGAE